MGLRCCVRAFSSSLAWIWSGLISTPHHPAYGINDECSLYLPARVKWNQDQTRKGEGHVPEHIDYWCRIYTRPCWASLVGWMTETVSWHLFAASLSWTCLVSQYGCFRSWVRAPSERPWGRSSLLALVAAPMKAGAGGFEGCQWAGLICVLGSGTAAILNSRNCGTGWGFCDSTASLKL